MSLRRSIRRLVVVAVVALCVAAAVVPTPARAWWGKGHLTVAQIALNNLRTPENVPKLQAIVDAMHTLGPYDDYNTCVDVAMWADDLKAIGLYTMSSWHFVNHIYNPANIEIFTKAKGDFMFANTTFEQAIAAKRNPVSVVNVENVIPMLVDALTKQTPFQGAGNPDGLKYSELVVSSLANLIHYVGDIHQPLHSTALFSDEFPKGDRGGNSVNVWYWGTPNFIPSGDDSKKVKMNLHAFWDSIGQGPQDDPDRPLSPANAKAIADYAAHLQREYIFPEQLRNELNSSVYAAESHDVAKRYVYNFGSGQSNTAILQYPDGIFLNRNYIQSARTVAEQRVALAGYRLAAQLEAALPAVSMEDIQYGLRNVRSAVRRGRNTMNGANNIDNDDWTPTAADEKDLYPPAVTHNYFTNEKPVTAGAAAAIALAAAAVGGLTGTAITILACIIRRQRRRGTGAAAPAAAKKQKMQKNATTTTTTKNDHANSNSNSNSRDDRENHNSVSTASPSAIPAAAAAAAAAAREEERDEVVEVEV